ncbi:DUF5633 domain-containing protein [Aerococcus sp. UMB7834]|uniref:DUF5633 domain-containing protein n=1 Tax=Aerococcus sp. UMB7834 TaxID=3046342 RepID=UPI00254FD224|nr:DUF5633 domain-containing protein [Aerococcus sp. UMB7834]MDK6804440.1 DUF5633 domain-containing protein [Aerococcus sp. UMB7834]
MNFKKVLLGSIATTAAAGTLFASQLQVAEAAAYETPVDENGNVILGGAPDVNPADKSATPGGSNQFELSLDENGVPTTVSNNQEAKPKSVQDLKEQNLNEGFKTKTEAEEAAKKVLKEDKVNKSFTVSQGANSNYYFSLSPNEPAKKADTKDNQASVEALKEQNAGEGFATKAEAEEAAKKVLAEDEVNKSFTVSQGANSNYYFVLSPNEAEAADTEKSEVTVEDLKEQNAGEGFATKAEAEEAAKKVLAEDKVNKSFTVSQGANSNYYFLLSPNEAEKAGQEDKKDSQSEDKKDTKSETVKELEEQNLNDGFKTKEEAEEAAKKVLAEDKINKSFTVSQGANDNYYYLLSPNEAEKAGQEDKKDNKSEDKKGNKSEDNKSGDKKNTKGEDKDKKSDKEVAADKKVAAKKSDAVKANGKKEAAKKAKTTLPKTGAVASAAPAVLGLALASVGTAFAFGKKKEDK